MKIPFILPNLGIEFRKTLPRQKRGGFISCES